MAFGDAWELTYSSRPGQSVTGVVMEVCPWREFKMRRPEVVTAVVLSGEVFYLGRVLGPGDTGPFVPVESENARRLDGGPEW